MESDKFIKENIAGFWNHRCETYDTGDRKGNKESIDEKAWEKTLSELIPGTGKKVLDIGAGTGFLTLRIARAGHIVKAVDLSKGMLEKAEEKISEEGLTENVLFEVGDAESLNEESDKYDVVINRHILWTLHDPGKAIKEWLRVTKPGGKVIIIDGDWKLADETDRVIYDYSYKDEVIKELPIFGGDKYASDYIADYIEDTECLDLSNLSSYGKQAFIITKKM